MKDKRTAPNKSLKQDWQTPQHLIDLVHWVFPDGFLDPCTTKHNPTGAETILTTDGLSVPWVGRGAYVNPPFNEAQAWCKKVGQEARIGLPILLLLSASNRAGCKYFQCHIFGRHQKGCECLYSKLALFDDSSLDAMLHISKRLHFINPLSGEAEKGNTRGSILYGFNMSLSRFYRVFGELGTVFPGPLR